MKKVAYYIMLQVIDQPSAKRMFDFVHTFVRGFLRSNIPFVQFLRTKSESLEIRLFKHLKIETFTHREMKIIIFRILLICLFKLSNACIMRKSGGETNMYNWKISRAAPFRFRNWISWFVLSNQKCKTRHSLRIIRLLRHSWICMNAFES